MEGKYGIYTEMYNKTIAGLESGKMLPNLRGIRKEIRCVNKSIRTLVKGSEFCTDMVMLEKTEKALKRAKDKKNALEAILNWVNNKINANK